EGTGNEVLGQDGGVAVAVVGGGDQRQVLQVHPQQVPVGQLHVNKSLDDRPAFPVRVGAPDAVGRVGRGLHVIQQGVGQRHDDVLLAGKVVEHRGFGQPHLFRDLAY